MEQLLLGSRTLQPRRELLADGARVPLGRRALELLSILAEAGGEIVTKDELFRAAWPNAIVEENALQAHIVAIRKALGREADRLVTIRGVGYRLLLDTDDAALAIPSPALREDALKGPRARSRRWMAAALAMGLAAILIVGLLQSRPDVLNVSVQAFETTANPESQQTARLLRADIIGVLTQSGIETTERQSAGFLAARSNGTLVLTGSILETRPRVVVRMLLVDRPSGVTLWSAKFEKPAAAADMLVDQAAIAAADAIHSISEIRQQAGYQLNPRLTALYMRGSELTRSPDSLAQGAPRKLFEEIVREAPEFAGGHAMLALALANEARRGLPAARPALLERAEREIDAAIAIDPYAAGAAYDARYFVHAISNHPGGVAQTEDLLLEGLRRAPDFPFLSMRECRFLMDVGRAGDALPYCQRALALRPFAAPIGHSYARALNAANRRELAASAIERAIHLNPDQAMTRAIRFEMAALYSSPHSAMALLEDPDTQPVDLSALELESLKLFLTARMSNRPEDIALAMAAIRRAAGGSTLDLGVAVKLLTALGAIDEAFELLSASKPSTLFSRFGTGYLFEPVTAPLRTDPRFWAIAERTGLVRYWRERKTWPDFCSSESSPEACKKAARASPAR